MSKGLELINKVKEYFKEVRKKYSSITNDMLIHNGTIYYMNGNDGTEFDWFANNRMCEFMVFYKETEYGFMKCNIFDDGTLRTYIYMNSGFDNNPEYHEVQNFLTEEDALYLASLLFHQADECKIYDEAIEFIDFTKIPYYLLENNEEY